ncbi:hypothetical protein TRFO_07376 [Tritrichomonas foetus]|uniref:Calpain catalytic domain-containing protein n=1 Tax=Tritrichomonas foetus TaxID=1144522 RepID=A0A1J4JRR9_9EUKA|nr:hypothetical protein TRFO_07376 [Tritrichomonas foetus]|eukprot:OHT01817.1 hypothetical protein TRFO_07376 [Tritrichomonas foetus]
MDSCVIKNDSHNPNEEKFVDEDFHPVKKIIENDPFLVTDVEWERIEHLYNSPMINKKISPKIIRQGYLGDCHLISALCSISCSYDHVNSLFDNSEDLPPGSICVKFHYFGEIKKIIVDTLVPLKNNRMILSRPKTKNDPWWFTIIEKAYAKLFGSFGAIVGGNSDSTFFRLVGGWPFAFYFDDPDVQELLHNDKMWKRMKRWNRKGYFMCCGSLDGPMNMKNEKNIYFSHSYSILKVVEIKKHKLIYMRNTWGKSEWSGKWGINSTKWNDFYLKELKYKKKNDGNFWINFHDFKKYFNSLYVDIILKSNWKNYGIGGTWLPSNNNIIQANNMNDQAYDPHTLKQWIINFELPTTIKCTFEKGGEPAICYVTLIKEGNNKESNIFIDADQSIFTQIIPKISEVTSFHWTVEEIDTPWILCLCRESKNTTTPFYLTIYSLDDILITPM